MITLYFGPVINPRTLTYYLALPRCLIAVGTDGNIIWIEDDVERSALEETIVQHGLRKGNYTIVDLCLRSGEFIMPGFIDTHIHACQFPNLGIGGECELLEWLLKYAYPTESKFEDIAYAEEVYTDVVERTIASGTTTCCYYGSLHLASTARLADIVRKRGQRAFVGKCNMDLDCPSSYIEPSADKSIEQTIALIEHIRCLPPSPAGEPLVHPIITPRSALCCSDELLSKLGKLAAALPRVSIQTHISEHRQEITDVLTRFQTDSFAEVYDRYGLLRHNTVLDHAVWLNEKDVKMIAQRGAGVAHCPTSNFNLTSGMTRVGWLLDHGVKVGLGTDVSGGHHPSILYAIQMANVASKMLYVQAKQTDNKLASKSIPDDKNTTTASTPAESKPHFTNQKFDVPTLLYLATKGGAEVCCLDDRIGSFEVGKAFDALRVNILDETSNPAIWGSALDDQDGAEQNLRRWLGRFLFCGDDRNVSEVFVQGSVIGGYATARRFGMATAPDVDVVAKGVLETT